MNTLRRFATQCFVKYCFSVKSHQAYFNLRLKRQMATLETLNFDNKASRSLPIDKVTDNYVRKVKGACYSKVTPTPVSNPQLVAVSNSALELLDLASEEAERKEFLEYFSGNAILPGSDPVAHCYCGHQFGYFAGQLGDGAAITLGEIVNKSNERWEIQLKGAGKTPFSRTADGRKVLRSSIREFLCSEAMHFLGIPTTRAACILTSDSTVDRDIFYDGHPILEKCSIVCRISPTFIRFGSFQICKGPDRETGNEGPSAAQPDVVKRLLDYVIEIYYPDIWNNFLQKKSEMYAKFFGEVVRRTARLVAHWQCVGWCHGVLNTDNMSILGLTIDYGPYGFMDLFNSNHICNASGWFDVVFLIGDTGGRYAYKNQPEMCKWNCEKLADMLQLFTDMNLLKVHLDKFMDEFNECYFSIMRKKLGLMTVQEADMNLINEFLETMEKTGADFTNSFRCLSTLPLPGCKEWKDLCGGDNDSVGISLLKEKLLEQCASVEEMKLYYKPEIDPRNLAELLALLETNPELKRMLGKQQQQLGIELKKLELFNYFNLMEEETKKINDSELWDKWLQSYVGRLKLEVQSITNEDSQSSIKLDDLDNMNRERISIMNSNNPRFILRNYIAQQAIDAAEKGDFSKVGEVLRKLERPFDDELEEDEVPAIQQLPAEFLEGACSNDSELLIKPRSHSFLRRPPKWAAEIKVT